MLWNVLEINNRYIHEFLALPNQELRHLSLSPFTMLCYVLISQAKAAFALLDCLEASDGIQNDEEKLTMIQLVITRAGFNGACASIIEKFDVTLRGSRAAFDNVDAMLQFYKITKTIMLGYSSQLQDKLGPRAAHINTAAGDTSTQLAGTAGLSSTEDRPLQQGVDTIEIENWGNVDMMSTDDIGTFDGMTWETIMNEFMLPVGGHSGPG